MEEKILSSFKTLSNEQKKNILTEKELNVLNNLFADNSPKYLRLIFRAPANNKSYEAALSETKYPEWLNNTK